MARTTITEDARTFFEAMPTARRAEDSSISNMKLREKLDWPEKRYNRVRDYLLEQGLVRKGLGRGGSVVKLTTRFRLRDEAA